MRKIEDCKRPFVIIGTSGSPGYLKDPTGNQRYWPATSSPPSSTPPSTENLAVEPRLVEALKRIVEMCEYRVTVQKCAASHNDKRDETRRDGHKEIE